MADFLKNHLLLKRIKVIFVRLPEQTAENEDISNLSFYKSRGASITQCLFTGIQGTDSQTHHHQRNVGPCKTEKQ